MVDLVMDSESETRSIFRPALLLMCGRTLAFAATFFIPVVLTRSFGSSQFGTYKQLFLIQSTIFSIAQFGMASSPYYFVPGAHRDAGRYAANSTVFLGLAGAVACSVVMSARPWLARWMNNSDLPQYLPWIGLYSLFMLLSSSCEIVMIARGRYRLASATYAFSDVARALAMILPVLIFRHLDSLLQGAVVVAALRALGTLFYFRREFRDTFRLDFHLLGRQLGYAIPFGLAVLVEILQGSFPQYAVSHWFNPTTLATFAIGCMQIPLIDFATSPASDVMMTKMQEALCKSRKPAVLSIWRDTTWKLALLFFPLVAFLMLISHDFIVLLFSAKYLASVPLFMAWIVTIPLSAFQVDGVLRVFAQTRLLLVLNLTRFAIIAVLIQWSLLKLQLMGGVLVILLATFVFKAAALFRIRSLLNVSLVELLPWGRLTALLAAAAGSAGVVHVTTSQARVPMLQHLVQDSLAFAVVYILSVWKLKLLTGSERLALKTWVRKSLHRLRSGAEGTVRTCAALPES